MERVKNPGPGQYPELPSRTSQTFDRSPIVIAPKDMAKNSPSLGKFNKQRRNIPLDLTGAVSPGPAAYNPMRSLKLMVSRR
jgi:hypothetical protein